MKHFLAPVEFAKLSAIALLAIVTGGALPLEAEQNPLADLIRSADSAERRALEAKVASAPDDASLWFELAGYSYQYDQPEETVAIIRRALEKHCKNELLWGMLAQVYLMDARSGPNWIQRPGVTRSRQSKAALGEKEFREKSLTAALDALDHIIEINPSDWEAAEQRVKVLFELERWADAETSVQVVLQNSPSGKLAALRGFALLKLGRKEDARAYIDHSVAHDRNCADLHFVRARILEAFNEETAAAEEDAQGEFYGNLLPRSHLEFTPELAASLKRMFGKKEGASGMFSGDRLNDEISAEIDSLAARNDETSSELLASLAWSHFAHGPLEDRAFNILGARGDIPRLTRIYENARSPCTIRGCLRQLVRLRAEGTYEKLCELLPNDGGMFPIGVVELMAELKDPRSAEPLIAYTRSKEAPFFESALVALGDFDSAAVRAHLEKWYADKAVAPYAATALYKLTKAQKWVKPISTHMNKAELYELRTIAEGLKSVDTPAAKKIVEKFFIREKKAAEKKDAAKEKAKKSSAKK